MGRKKEVARKRREEEGDRKGIRKKEKARKIK